MTTLKDILSSSFLENVTSVSVSYTHLTLPTN